jgi:rSAM/selenodomain-associated transferase 2
MKFGGWIMGCIALTAALLGLGITAPWGLGFSVCYLAAFAAVSGAVYHFPSRWGYRQALLLALALGACLRLLMLPFPVNSDLYRYIWEGLVQLSGYNPFRYAPADAALAALAKGPGEAIWPLINHKEWSAAYPPLALLLFRGLAVISISPLFFKLVIVLADLLTLLPLAALARHHRLPPGRIIWYAANPLLLVFIAGEGHLDSLMVLGLVTGLAFLFADRDRTGWFFLGCAAMIKYWAVLAVPFMLRKDNWKQSWTFLVPCAAYFFYLDAGSHLFVSLWRFGSRMHYNDFIPALIRPWAGGTTVWIAGLLLAIGLSLIFLLVQDRLHSLRLSFGLLLLCLPTVHPWYHALMAPLAALWAAPTWLSLQALQATTFPVLLNEHSNGVFQEIQGLKFISYSIFALIAIFILRRGGIAYPFHYHAVQTISVVIPAINEAERIQACVASLQSSQAVTQIIVVDGGSRDETPQLAEQAGAIVLASPRKGRGHQIAAGIARCHSDVLMVLHADCRLWQPLPQAILKTLNQNPNMVGGAVQMAFATKSWRGRLIATLNNWRARLTGIAFGDQAQFWRRQAHQNIGAYPRQLLMEDVEWSLRLRQVGRVKLLPLGLTVSARRWEHNAFTANFAKVIWLLGRYLIERRLGLLDPEAHYYYQSYYGK